MLKIKDLVLISSEFKGGKIYELAVLNAERNKIKTLRDKTKLQNIYEIEEKTSGAMVCKEKSKTLVSLAQFVNQEGFLELKFLSATFKNLKIKKEAEELMLKELIFPAYFHKKIEVDSAIKTNCELVKLQKKLIENKISKDETKSKNKDFLKF